MAKVQLLDSALLHITILRVAQQLIEDYDSFKDTVMLGLQPKGIFFAQRLVSSINQLEGIDVPLGKLDTTFFRDDFRRRADPLEPNATDVPFIIEDKNVILVDDVLFTGRSVRAAMSAMMAYGRPKKVDLVALIDRKYSRDLPIEANYIGRTVNTIQSQKVKVEWVEQGHEQDIIWLVNKTPNS